MDCSLDGKEYRSYEAAPVGCDDCKGCSSCCREMGDTVIQDPYDLWLFTSNMRLAGGAKVSFDILISEDGPWELSVHDGIVLPNIKMVEDGRCPFLGANGRCSIHKFRSGLCRLFPLGRGFREDGSVIYYVLNDELGCEKQKGPGTDVVISEWLGIDNIEDYEKYQAEWHALKKNMIERAEHADAQQKMELNKRFLDTFYGREYGRDFFAEIKERIIQFKI